MTQDRASVNDTDTAGVDDPLRVERDRLAVVLELLLQAVYETVPQDRWRRRLQRAPAAKRHVRFRLVSSRGRMC